jgi:hypothetical protein
MFCLKIKAILFKTPAIAVYMVTCPILAEFTEFQEIGYQDLFYSIMAIIPDDAF